MVDTTLRARQIKPINFRSRRWGLHAEMGARLQAERLRQARNPGGAAILNTLAGVIGLANAAKALFRRRVT